MGHADFKAILKLYFVNLSSQKGIAKKALRIENGVKFV